MYTKFKRYISGVTITSRRAMCLTVLLILGMLTGTAVADSCVVGTWTGTWAGGGYSGYAFDWVLEPNGSASGSWDEPLESWVPSLSGTVKLTVSGTYTYYPMLPVFSLTINASGWTRDIHVGDAYYDAYCELMAQGTVSDDCNSINGAGSIYNTSIEIYEGGEMVDSDTDTGTWQLHRSTPLTFIDIGLRVYDGTGIVKIACEPQGTLTSPLRIAKNGVVYGIVLVDVSDTNASKIRIQTSSGVKALRKF